MNSKISLVILLACACGQIVSGASLIELNDANQAILNLEVSKQLKSVQNAYSDDFKFETIESAVSFVSKCQALKEVMDQAKESDFEGLAGKIKTLLGDEKLAKACSVNARKVHKKFANLDQELAGAQAYLSERKTNQFKELKAEVESNPSLAVVLGHFVEKKSRDLGNSLFKDGGRDVTVMFAEQLKTNKLFDLDSTKYKSGCQISELKPICKLVRRYHRDDVDAIGEDFVDFVQIVDSNNIDKIEYHEAKSDVSLSSVRESCAKMVKSRNFKAVRQLDDLKKSGVLTENQVIEGLYDQPLFNLYVELYHLCAHLSN